MRLSGSLAPFLTRTFVDATGALMFSCFRCSRVYQHMKTLNRHLRHECGKGKQFICVFCGHRTQRSDRLLTHIRSQHPKLAQDFPKRKQRHCGGTEGVMNSSGGVVGGGPGGNNILIAGLELTTTGLTAGVSNL